MSTSRCVRHARDRLPLLLELVRGELVREARLGPDREARAGERGRRGSRLAAGVEVSELDGSSALPSRILPRFLAGILPAEDDFDVN